MRDDKAIPAKPLELNYSNTGFLPHVGLYRKGEVFVQESSRVHFWFLGVMSALAVGALFLPWNKPALLGLQVRHVVAIGCLWGGICGLAPYFIRNRYAQVVTIDPAQKTIRIQQRGLTLAMPMVAGNITIPEMDVLIPWSELLALQICYQGGAEYPGYQLNLVRKHDGDIERHCLLQHAIRAYVAGLAAKYQKAFGFRIVDHTI